MAHIVAEHLLAKNSYEEPKVIYDDAAAYTLIVRLLLLEPGKDPNRPNMGVGLVSRYRFSHTDNLEDLKSDIRNQINTYLPNLTLASVNVKPFGNTLGIYIETNNITYGIEYNQETGELVPMALEDARQ